MKYFTTKHASGGVDQPFVGRAGRTFPPVRFESKLYPKLAKGSASLQGLL